MGNRPYNSERDFEYIHDALKSEGLRRKEMTFEADTTIITDIGFFSYVKESQCRYPYLHHFYVNKDQRSLKNFLRLSGQIKHAMLARGFLMFVAQEPKHKPNMGRFIRFSRGIELYKRDGHTYYLVPVLKKGCKKHDNL